MMKISTYVKNKPVRPKTRTAASKRAPVRQLLTITGQVDAHHQDNLRTTSRNVPLGDGGGGQVGMEGGLEVIACITA